MMSHDLSNGESNDAAKPSQSTPSSLSDTELKFSDPKQLKIYKGLLLSVAYTASIGGTGTLVGTAPNLILADAINSYYPKSSPLSFSNWMLFAIPGMFFMTFFCWLWLQFLFIGFKRQNREAEKAVHHLLRQKYENLGSIRPYSSYSEGSVMMCLILQVFIWVTRHPGFVTGWGDWFQQGYVTDGTASMAVSILLFILPRENPFLGLRKTGQFPSILTWADIQSRFSWSTIILLGGSFAMAKGVKTSGLSDLFGHELKAFESLPDWLFVSIAAILATALTEFSSNVATASLFIPILTSIAHAHNANPMHYLFPVVISCSFAFMFPAGTPPNAIVFSSGLLKVSDMFRAGCMLNLFGLFLTVFMTYSSFADLIFNMAELPESWNTSLSQKM